METQYEKRESERNYLEYVCKLEIALNMQQW